MLRPDRPRPGLQPAGAVWNAQVASGALAPLVEQPDRLAHVSGLGVDDHAWRQRTDSSGRDFAIGIVHLSPGRSPRLLDVPDGRSGRVCGGRARADLAGE